MALYKVAQNAGLEGGLGLQGARSIGQRGLQAVPERSGTDKAAKGQEVSGAVIQPVVKAESAGPEVAKGGDYLARPGDNVFYTGDGSDKVFAGRGSDLVFTEGGDDVLFHATAPNVGETDVYDGGTGEDELRLYVDINTWSDPAFQADMAAWVEFSTSNPAAIETEPFVFESLGLTITSVEEVKFLVEREPLDPTDEPVIARDDSAIVETGQDTATGNVLRNDDVPDLVSSIALNGQPEYGTVTLTSDGKIEYTLDFTDPDVQAWAGVGALMDSFAYTVTDVNGDTDSATVAVTILGSVFSLDLATLDGSNGFMLVGNSDFEDSGFIVSSAGDVNGDGFDDLMIGTYFGNEAYVVYGRDTATEGNFDASFDLGSLDGSNGFIVSGIGDRDNLGLAVASAGDVNGDGFDDIMIGASYADDLAGQTYVIFGRDTATEGNFDASFDLETLDGSNGFVLNGIDVRDFAGYSVSSAGDLNGDGIDDILISAAWAADKAGETYVIYGRDTATEGDFDASFDLGTLDGSNGFTLVGAEDNFTGTAVTSAGDVNNDGIDDILIGARSASEPGPGNTGQGAAYVIYGIDTATDGDFAANFDLESLDGSNGFTLVGSGELDTFGYSVASAGDVNSDGIDDMLIGSPNVDFGSGEAYVIFGRDTATEGEFEAVVDQDALDGINGFVVSGIGSKDALGGSVSSAGDVNGDGIDDILIGATNYPPNHGGEGNTAGQAYVIFGRDTSTEGDFAASFDLETLDGSNGFVINGIDVWDLAGFSVSSAGDLNGDGFDDILIGAQGPSYYGAGEAYVVFGRETFEAELDNPSAIAADEFLLM